MENLQETIDRVFGDVEHKPKRQPLSDAAIRRAQAFAEGARKIEALRAARLGKAASCRRGQ
jgi:hypothetical protein